MKKLEDDYDPKREIIKQFFLAVRCIKKYRGTPDEQKFREIALHLQKELTKRFI